MTDTLVTFTVLRYPPRRWYRAFANMGRWLMRPFRAEGLHFQKLMGSGRGFSLTPDLSTYVFLAVWETEAAATRFFDSTDWKKYADDADETGTLRLQPYRSHGTWDGQKPFGDDLKPTENSASLTSRPVAVLTRATIRTGALVDFWRNVPQARQPLQNPPDELVFAIGVGEKPVVQQCTVSVWRNQTAVEQFAYRQKGHKEMVRRTRERRWYTEELFARFVVTGAEGFFKTLLAQKEQTALS